MPAAYTTYKFGKMFGLVLTIFFILIIFSIINPIKQEVTEKLTNEVDSTGLASSALNTYNSVPDPKSDSKEAGGNFLYRIMQNNPKGFFGLALIITIILFASGVYLRDVRNIVRRL